MLFHSYLGTKPARRIHRAGKVELPPNHLLFQVMTQESGRSRQATMWPTHSTGFHDRCRIRDSDTRAPTNHHAERDWSSLGHTPTPESRYDDAIIREQSQSLGSTKTEEIPRFGKIGMPRSQVPKARQRDCASQLCFPFSPSTPALYIILVPSDDPRIGKVPAGCYGGRAASLF